MTRQHVTCEGRVEPHRLLQDPTPSTRPFVLFTPGTRVPRLKVTFFSVVHSSRVLVAQCLFYVLYLSPTPTPRPALSLGSPRRNSPTTLGYRLVVTLKDSKGRMTSRGLCKLGQRGKRYPDSLYGPKTPHLGRVNYFFSKQIFFFIPKFFFTY